MLQSCGRVKVRHALSSNVPDLASGVSPSLNNCFLEDAEANTASISRAHIKNVRFTLIVCFGFERLFGLQIYKNPLNAQIYLLIHVIKQHFLPHLFADTGNVRIFAMCFS